MKRDLLELMFEYGDKKKYLTILKDKNYNEVAAMYEFKKDINRRRIKIIKMEEITNNIDNKELLAILIENLFLEYIDTNYLKDVERIMIQNGWDWTDVYGEHIKYPNKRLWRIVSTRRM